MKRSVGLTGKQRKLCRKAVDNATALLGSVGKGKLEQRSFLGAENSNNCASSNTAQNTTLSPFVKSASPPKMKCEFCDADAVEFVGRKVRLCQTHISECLSLYYQNERR